MKWVSCEKALPEHYEAVLVWVFFEKTPAKGEAKLCWHNADGWALSVAHGFTVTHWMQIEPPE